MCKILLLLLVLNSLSKSQDRSSSTVPKKESAIVAILIHGTWGIESAWHQPGALFYDTLKHNLLKNNIKLIDFNWSGKLSYQKRKDAGINLANLINSYPRNTAFILITHSHGGNVGIIASQLLNIPNQILAFYSLGLPVDVKNYLPNMQVIKNFYNIFSFGDLHQTAFGMHERILPISNGIYNVNIEINHVPPQHEELHGVSIAKWLMHIDKKLSNLSNCQAHFFARFYDNDAPNISIETELVKKINFDAKLHEKICLGMFRS